MWNFLRQREKFFGEEPLAHMPSVLVWLVIKQRTCGWHQKLAKPNKHTHVPSEIRYPHFDKSCNWTFPRIFPEFWQPCTLQCCVSENPIIFPIKMNSPKLCCCSCIRKRAEIKHPANYCGNKLYSQHQSWPVKLGRYLLRLRTQFY